MKLNIIVESKKIEDIDFIPMSLHERVKRSPCEICAMKYEVCYPSICRMGSHNEIYVKTGVEVV